MQTLNRVLIPLICFVTAPSFAAEEELAGDSFFFEVGVGAMTDTLAEDFLVLPANTQLEDAWIPTLRLGVGYEMPLTPEIELATTLSLSHARSNDFRSISPLIMQNANVENTGIWIDTRLANTSWFDGIKPFVSVGAGQVYGQYSDAVSNLSGWESGVRASVGVEFEITKDHSISFEFVTADMGELDVPITQL